MHQTGDIIKEQYRITDILGEGGIGITYAAEDINSGEEVAIKALSLCHLNDWKILQLFEREAKTLSHLNHPAIPRYIDYFEIDVPENRAFYIIQQRSPGKSFAELVNIGWRTNEREIRQIAVQVLEILIYLHSLNPPVFHRDIKPQNLIYDKQKVYLVDFGAVKNTYQNTIARGSTVVGTFGYMAPEQFRGHTSASTDLYGLGATLLFLLSHRSPTEFPQERLKIKFRSHIQVSENFADWLEKMLEPDMEERFSSAQVALVSLKQRQIVNESENLSSLYQLIGILILTVAFGIYAYFFRWQVWGWVNYLPPDICYPMENGSTLKYYLNYGGNIYALNHREKFVLTCWLTNQNINRDSKKMIISKISDINAKYDNGMAALHYANSLEWVELLVETGANVNIKDKYYQQTPLHFAHSRPLKIVEYLIAKGADVNARNSDGKTPLDVVFKAFVSVPKLNNEQISLIKLLLKNRAKTTSKVAETLLHQVKSIQLAKIIITNGVNVNAKDEYGNTPLHMAVYNENYELIDLLIRKGANINLLNKERKVPLHLAMDIGTPDSKNNTKLAAFLINRGASLKIYHPVGNSNLLHLSTSLFADKNFIEFLLNKGVDINAKNDNGNTPLDIALMGSQVEVIKLLREKGAKKSRD
jgi:serine/threonine protein kinase